MQTSNTRPVAAQALRICLSTILFLFFLQLLTEFVEAIYLFGLLGSSIPPEIGMVLLFISPIVLFVFRGKIPPRWINILATIMLLMRAIEVALPTRGRMIAAGVGVAAGLIFFTALLSLDRSAKDKRYFVREAGASLGLAIIISILLRAVHSGSDISGYGMFRLITWGLALMALVLLWLPSSSHEIEEKARKSQISRIYAYAIGIASVIIILYFAFSAPNVVARWAGASKISVFFVLLLAWLVVGWWWMRRENLNLKMIFGWGLAFTLAVMFAILPHQVIYPAGMNAGYPLLEPQISSWQILPLYLMLILSPVLMLAFIAYLDGLLAENPSLNKLAGAFGLAGFYILVMVFAHVFTTVYDYIPIVGPFFRDKYWLVFLIPSLTAVLPALLSPASDDQSKVFSNAARRGWVGTALVLSLLTLVGLSLTSASQTEYASSKDTLRIFTYNIQQGYSEAGERNFDGQLDLLGSKTPDIIGLQESDTARIASGNADVVAYLADRLEMYSYYGPSPVSGTFGIALLSRYPIGNPRTYYLYSEGEQVAIIDADIRIDDKSYKVFVTHLGNGGPMIQVRQMLDLIRGESDVILMGDFNFRPYEEQYAITVTEIDDAYSKAERLNIPADFEVEERIDHVFLSPGLSVIYLEYLTQPESDHPGLFVELSR